MTFKVLPFCLLLAILPAQSSARENIIGATSASEAWRHGTPAFWPKMAEVLVAGAKKHDDFGKVAGNGAKIAEIVSLINGGYYKMYNFEPKDLHEIWAAFKLLLSGFVNPTVPEKVDNILMHYSVLYYKADLKIADLQYGLNISINHLPPAAQNFISDVCTLLMKICKVRMFQKEALAIFGKFLHDSLTTAPSRAPKSTSPADPRSYKIYEIFFANFGDMIYHENGQFFFSKIFGNNNVESCFHRGLIQHFYLSIVRFLLEKCVMVPDVFRKAGNIAKLNGMEPAIDKGDTSFLDVNRCVDVVAPIFKRFLTSFYEPIIPIEIADIMRLTPRNDPQFNLKVVNVLKSLSRLPEARKVIINDVLRIANAMFRNSDKNNWGTEGAIAKIFDPCLSKINHSGDQQSLIAKTTRIQQLNYPMLTVFIENWGAKVYYDEKVGAFLARKFSLKSFSAFF